jgi:hypothetical protein
LPKLPKIKKPSSLKKTTTFELKKKGILKKTLKETLLVLFIQFIVIFGISVAY